MPFPVSIIGVYKRCFILKTDEILYAVSVSVSWPAQSALCCLTRYSPWSRAGSRYWDACEMLSGAFGGITIFVWNGHKLNLGLN